MSNYSFSDQDLEQERSLNRYREEMLRQEAERRAEEARREMGQPASDFVKEAERQLTRTIRSAIQDDPVAHEARSAYLTASTVVNIASFIALSVGSLAAETAYTRSIMSSQDDYKEMYKDALNQRQDELSRDDRTLAAYQQRVDDTRRELAKNDPEYAQEYRQTTEESRERVREAEQTYKTESNDIRSQQRQADTTYRETTQQCQTRLQESQQIFSDQTAASQARTDSMISNANDAFERERTRIEKEYPAGKERQEALSAAATARDTRIENARELHEMNVAGYRDEMRTRNEPIHREMDQAASRHQITTNQLTERQTAADTRRQDIVTRERANIETATQKYDTAAAAAKKEYKGAQAELAKYNDSLRSSAANSMMMDEKRGFTNVGRGADRLVGVIASNQSSLGNALAAHLGTDRERELIAKYNADRQAAKEAKENGTSYKSTISDKEKEQIQAISRKYAGNISSESGVEKSLSALKKATKDLSDERTHLDKALTSLRTQMTGVNEELKQQKAALLQLKADQDILKKGVDANGKRLSPEERKKIQERVNSQGPAIAKRLDDLKKTKTGLTTSISKAEQKLSRNSQLMQSIESQTKFLKKHGKIIANTNLERLIKAPKIWNPYEIGFIDKLNRGMANITKKISPVRATSKKALQMQKKATNTLFKSVSTLKREFDRAAHKGNDLHKEIMSLTRGAARIAGKYNQALAVAQFTGKVALKVLKVPGGMFRTIGKGTFRVLGKSQFFNRISNSGFVKGMGKVMGVGGKFVRGTGRVFGAGAGMILKAPGVILMAPMKLQQLPQTIAKAALNGTIRTTRKIVGKTVGGTARLAGKGVRLVGKGVKAGFKATIGRTKWFNKLSNRFKQLKGAAAAIVKKILNPINVVKAWAAKIWAMIASWIGSLLSAIGGFLLEVLGYVAIGALILLIVLLAGSVFAAILETIKAFFADITANGKMYCVNRTEDILNFASLYREGELKLYYRFKDSSGMIPSDNPLYTDGFTYEALIGEATRGSIFVGAPLFSNVKLLNADNNTAKQTFYDVYASINSDSKNTWKSKMSVTSVEVTNGTKKETTSTTYVDWFKEMSWGLYTNDDYKLPVNANESQLSSSESITAAFKARLSKYEDTQVTYKTATGSTAIYYEISNAKDIMALFDTVFQDDPNHTSVCEMMMYLSGPTHLKKGTDGSGALWKCDCYGTGRAYDVDDCDTYKSFFWASHGLEYTEGTKASDVKFHSTSTTATTGYDGSKIYSVNSGSSGILNGACTNYKILNLEYEHKVETAKHREDNINSWFSKTTPSTIMDVYKKDWITVNHVETGVLYPSNGKLTAMKLYYDIPYTTTYYTYNSYYGTWRDSHTYSFEKVGTNDIKDSTVVGWHDKLNNISSGAGETLQFYKYNGYKHRYYVADASGCIFGMVDLETSTYSSLCTAVTKFTYTNSSGTNVTTNINRNASTTAITLNYFEIYWDSSDKCYKFDVIGYNSSPSSVNTVVSSSAIQSTICVPITHEDLDVYCVGPSVSGHKETTTETKTVKYHVCGGHVNLKATIRVATMDDKDYFWHLAEHIYPLPNGYDIDSFLGLYQGDTEINGINLDVNGWGSEDIPAYKPYKDWQDPKKREMATAKRGAVITYDLGNSNAADDHIKLSYRGSGNGTFPSLVEHNGDFLFGFTAFTNKACYAYGFQSGIQSNIECFVKENGSWVKKIVNHKIESDGSANPVLSNP